MIFKFIRNCISEFLESLRHQGIDAKCPVHKPLHRMLALPDSNFPVTACAARECASLPIFPLILDSETARVADSVRAAIGGLKPAGVTGV